MAEKLTEQKKLEQRMLTPAPKLPYRFMALLSRVLYCKKFGVKFNYNIDLKQYRGKSYVVVSNHASRYDHAFTAPAFFPDTLNYVVGYNEFFRSHLAGLLRTLNVIPKKNFVPYPYSVKQMIRVIRQGGRIMIMPEGMSSISGANQPCAVGSGQLLKYLGVPVLYTKISGGYLTSTKYCLDDRPGRVEVTVDLLLSAEELSRMSEEEIQQYLNEKLYHDDYEWNKTAKVRFKGKNEMAKNLHTLLFWCPKCKKMLTMKSEGNTIECTACGNKANLNEYYELTAQGEDSLIPSTPKVWFDMQRSEVRKMVGSDNFELKENVKIGTLPEYGFLKKQATSEITGEGTLILNKSGLHFKGTKKGEVFEFDIAPKFLPTYGMCTDVSRFYTFVEGQFIEFYPEKASAELWMMATEENHRLNGGAWQDCYLKNEDACETSM